MTIKDIKQKLKTAGNPVAKSIHNGSGFNVLMMGFNKGMVLQEQSPQSIQIDRFRRSCDLQRR